MNNASEKELVVIFQDYGEERHARKIARAICQARDMKKIRTTADLSNIITSVVPFQRTHGKRGIHPATRVFQALRIVVNKELDNIKTFLGHSPEILNKEGRVVCISFHSLEDRIVKNYFRDHKEIFEILTPKIVVPTDEEVRVNPSSRSSRLRAARKI